MSRLAGLALSLVLVTAGCGATWPFAAARPAVEAPLPDRMQRIKTTRADLKVALTALELRAVSTCSEGRLKGEGCQPIQRLIDQGRVLDERLVAALLDPSVAVDWPAVTTMLRAVVQASKAP